MSLVFDDVFKLLFRGSVSLFTLFTKAFFVLFSLVFFSFFFFSLGLEFFYVALARRSVAFLVVQS